MKTKPKLIPPDRKQCQAETRQYRPFIIGGNVHDVRRCENVPVFISKEKKPGPDGVRGSMSLCDECAQIMRKQLGDNYATLTPIKRKAAINKATL